MLLWLDDIRTPPDDNWTWVKTFDAAVSMVVYTHNKEITIKHMSLDHDLGEGSTGYDFVVWLEHQIILHNYPKPVIKIHSANPVGRENMMRAIKSFSKEIR